MRYQGSMRLESGEHIDAYVVEGLIGVGGMSEVWAVRHSVHGSRHALKILLEPSQELTKRVEREARAMSSFHHPNLLPIESLLTVQGAPALLMPLVEGPSLDTLLLHHTPTMQEALALGVGVVSGLAEVHRRGLAHRDLKPANILLDPGALQVVPRVMDFGMVKVQDATLRTRAGMVMGTPAYAAPEQLRDARNADARSDLWSIGVLLCELLSGHRPYSAVSLGEILQQHRHPPDLSGVPASAVALLAALLRIEPAERLGDAGALLEQLRALRDEQAPLAAGGALAAVVDGLIPGFGGGVTVDGLRSLWSWGGDTGDGFFSEVPSVSPEVTIADQGAGVPETTIADQAAELAMDGEDEELLPGEQAIWTDRYVLEHPLGRGGMAVVWKAWDMRLETWRAIKILQPQFSSTRARRRFEQEAQAMARLTHRSIVTVHDISEHQGQMFLVMELVQGGALSRRLRRYGPLAPRQACQLMIDVLDALETAHAEGIVHRDIKPSNILLDLEGRPALTDFGIAQINASQNNLTRTGATLGTLSFMAPEQRVDASAVDARADVYASGATLWTLLTAREPLLFVAPEAEEELREQLPTPLADIVHRATRYRPRDRFDSAASMRAAIVDVLRKLPPDPVDTPPLVSNPRPDPEEPNTDVTLPEASTAPNPPASPAASSSRRWGPPAAALVGAGLLGFVVLDPVGWLEPPVAAQQHAQTSLPVREAPADQTRVPGSPAGKPAPALLPEPTTVSGGDGSTGPVPKPDVQPIKPKPPTKAAAETPTQPTRPRENSTPSAEIVAPPKPAVDLPAKVVLVGKVAGLRLISLKTNRTHSIGEVPPGRYLVEVKWLDGDGWAPQNALALDLGPGDIVQLACDGNFATCQKR